ncbi:MAG TPA: DinB family protein [Candidatus Acidoferrales bacterium]|nr:DinB family protein [Candidatus Acidoferrales bacterium]
MKRVVVTDEFKQYIARMKSYAGGRDPLKLMAASPAKLKRAVSGLSKAQLLRRPRPKKWSIQEILAHLADSEVVYGWRLRLMLAQPGLPLQPTDQDVWAATLPYKQLPAAKLLEQLQVLRESNLRLLKSVPRPWWNRYGMHLERGKETVGRMVVLLAGHDINHLNQIAAIRKQFGW